MEILKAKLYTNKANVYINPSFFVPQNYMEEVEADSLEIDHPVDKCKKIKMTKKSVLISDLRIPNFEEFYYTFLKRSYIYNQCTTDNLSLLTSDEFEHAFQKEVTKEYENLIADKFKFAIFGLKMFYDNVVHEHNMFRENINVFFKSKENRTKIKKNSLMDDVLSNMIYGSNVIQFEDSSGEIKDLTENSEYRERILNIIFNTNNRYLMIYNEITDTFLFSFESVKQLIRDLHFFDCPYLDLVWSLIFEVEINEKSSFYSEILMQLKNVISGLKKKTVRSKFQRSDGCICNTDSLKLAQDSIDEIMDVLDSLSCQNVTINAALLTQLRCSTVGLQFDNVDIFSFCLYIYGIWKYSDNVYKICKDLNLNTMINHMARFRKSPIEKYRFTRLLFNQFGTFQQVLNVDEMHGKITQECHDRLRPFIDEERRVWATAYLPLFAELVILESGLSKVRQKVTPYQHAASK